MIKEPKEIFEAYEDEEGWISKQVNEIAQEWEEDASERVDLLKQLWSFYHLHDKEFDNEDDNNSKWRFI